ncbi:MAG: hypothetical protein PF481_04255 [Bacteroidales bacterium]|jgi:hypothetical protein|nr:hypothetical protein [Bacteroidales bacterium]
MKDSENLDVEMELNSDKPEPKKGNSRAHVFYIIIILMLLGGAGYLYTLYTDSVEQIATITENINQVTQEKEVLYGELDSLEVEIEKYMGVNAKLDSVLLEKQAEITKIRGILRSQRADIREVKSLRNQIAVLKETAKEALEENHKLKFQVDSLEKVSTDRQRHIDTLEIMDFEKTRKLDSLTEKVQIGSAIRVGELRIEPYNRRGKEMTRARRVENFIIKGTMLKNFLAEAGTKTIYVRVTAPNGVVLTSSPENQFEYDGNTIMYTERREIVYQKEDTPFEIYYDASSDDLDEGIYRVVVFCNNKEVGKTEITLD